MTPKEKAKELFDKYFQIFDNIDYHDLCGDMDEETKDYSKQSALIVVGEVINNEVDYWEQVKEEINKI